MDFENVAIRILSSFCIDEIYIFGDSLLYIAI